MRVLITTSGLGSRLGKLTAKTNKSLISIGDKYAICRIIDIYPTDTEFVVSLGYYGNIVKDFLLLAYPTYTFYFVEVNPYDGEGSSLGYSMICCKQYLQQPFIFHCCDTILDELPTFDINSNTLLVVQSDDFDSYSSIKGQNNTINGIFLKGNYDSDFAYIGVSYIYNFELFWNHLTNIYSNNTFATSLSDIHVYKSMILDRVQFQYKVVNKWFDTGNVKSLEHTLKHFYSKFDILQKEDESICFIDNKVIKYNTNCELNKKRYLRGCMLYPLTPKIIDYSNNFIVMEFINGKLLSEVLLYGEIYSILQWAKEHLWINPMKSISFIENCKKFYYDKTLMRIKSLSFLNTEVFTVNGISMDSIYTLIEKIDMEQLCTDTFYNFHGDFILDNILKTEKGYILIDWRHEFDTNLEKGDMYYDLAKLYHNIIFNHKNIMNDLYSVEELDNSINIDLKCNYILIKQSDDFNRFIVDNNLSLKKIKILCALIWLNMSPLYTGKLSKFLFYFGKLNLYLNLYLN